MNYRKTRCHKFWPELVPKQCDVEKPLSEYIRDTAEKFPEHAAIRFYGNDLTYGELNAVIDRCSFGLMNLGIKQGDRVALHMQNCPQFVIAFFGILRAGAVVVAVNPMFKHTEIEYELNDSGAETYIGLDELYPEIEKIKDRVKLKHIILTSLCDYFPSEPLLPLPPQAKESERSFPSSLNFSELVREVPPNPICQIADMRENLALLQYTGGTTGLPKGAMISNYVLTYAAVGSAHWFDHSTEDVHLVVAPFFHLMGMLQSMCSPLYSGGQLVILSRFISEVVAQAISNYGCTAWVAAPTMLIALYNLPNIQKYDLTSFRFICTGGAPISMEIQNMMSTHSPEAVIVDGYGLTECVSQGGVITPLGRYKPGFVGVPHVNEVKIVDMETGQEELPPGKEGEILIKGPLMMSGYWNKPEETRQVIRNGWFYSGDIGMMDEEGYVKFIGRKKEMIICSGYNVYPVEVENILYKHPAVGEVAVVGVPDEYRGESPKAIVVLKDDFKGKITEAVIIDWCKKNMAAFKRPREVEFRKSLPKSSTGKILKRLLVPEE